MKILGGVHQPDGGEILIDGQPVAIHKVADATRYGIGFIHQELNVLDNLDVAANVFLGREPVYGGPLCLVNRRKMNEETQKLLNRLGLNISPRTPLVRLSVAERQLVEIAKALSLNARILIMDEPTSSLSLTESRLLLKVVDDLRAQGVGIIYISHRLPEIEEIADYVVVFRDGANAGNLTREEISHDRMVTMMVGRDIESFYQEPIGENTPGYFEVEGLRLSRYPERQISFSVGKGEILGIAGLVGAGRSEMAQAIFGVDRAIAAKLRLNNQPISIHSSRDAIKTGIYLVPEDRRQVGLITEISIRENLSLPALDRYATAGLMVLERERAGAKESCQRLNVKANSIEVKAANLSGGNQQKVVLAKWLALNPKVMIFDEPTRGIDVGAKAEVYQLMRQLAESGVAIIMISSDMEEVLHISDRVAVMHEGAINGILARQDCSEENIMQLAVGRHRGASRSGSGGPSEWVLVCGGMVLT